MSNTGRGQLSGAAGACRQGQPVAGAGLDHDHWNGALLATAGGAVFGVRIGFVRDGRLVSGEGFYRAVTRVGPRAPDGSYAQLAAGPLELRWSAVTSAEIIGQARAMEGPLTIVVEAYSPYDYPGAFCVVGPDHLAGWSPCVQVEPGSMLITGGHAIVEGRSRSVSNAPQREFFHVRTSAPAASTGAGAAFDPASLKSELADAAVLPGGISPAPDAPTAWLVYRLEAGQSLFIRAAAGGEGTAAAPVDAAAALAQLDRQQAAYAARRVRGEGPAGEAIVEANNELFWIATYQPYYRSLWVPPGRPWMHSAYRNGHPFNVWGWDEVFAAHQAAIESPRIAHSALAMCFQEMRNGPLMAWKIYCRHGDIDLLRLCYPYYRDYYRDAECVAGGPGNHEVGKGMDDTPMRDLDGPEMFSLDGTCQKAWNLHVTAEMARVLGEHQDAIRLERMYEACCQRINETFWHEQQGIYLNRYRDGQWRTIKSPTCFYPLLTAAPTPNMARRLVEHLMHPAEFWGEYVIPTLSRDDPEYGQPARRLGREWPPYCYWRGNIWAPTNYFVFLGLKHAGLDAEAAMLAGKSARLYLDNMRQFGASCENYDPITGRRSAMSHIHQSWSMLLATIAAEELLDVEGPAGQLRFGSLGADEAESLLNVPIRGRCYDVKSSAQALRLCQDGQVVFEARPGRLVVRQFQCDGDRLEFEAHTAGPVAATVRTAAAREVAVAIPAGRGRIHIEGEPPDVQLF